MKKLYNDRYDRYVSKRRQRNQKVYIGVAVVVAAVMIPLALYASGLLHFDSIGPVTPETPEPPTPEPTPEPSHEDRMLDKIWIALVVIQILILSSTLSRKNH
jgi:hypothetical protein